MVQVHVSKIKTGHVLLEDVLTSRGSTLFYKGRVLDERDIEILRAFMISEVSLQSSSKHEEVAEDEDVVEIRSKETVNQQFEQKYDSLLQLMKRVFKNTSIAENLPIVEMRAHLDSMVPFFESQDLLTYSPAKYMPEDYIYHKSIMVAFTAYMIASWSSFQQKDLIPIALAGLLHDIGNMGIDPQILNKPERLTAQEMEEMKKHTIIGYNRLKQVLGITEGVKLAALQHHEREDGSGYPLGVSGDKIHLYAKVVAIADIFYAMTRSRRYRNAKSPYEVLDQLMQDSFGRLSPSLVQTFVYRLTQRQIGYTIRLSNGAIGKIVFAEQANPTRPWVDVNGKIVNLAQERSLKITEVISRHVE